MRYIKVTGSPPEAWWNESLRIKELLKNAASDEDRKQIIESNEKHWSDPDFLNWLIGHFPRKCWYSEAGENVSSCHVAHFRPQTEVKELDGSSREGYWWLAFDWTNYRISGQRLNARKKDFFPLLSGRSAEPFNNSSLEIEAYILLDPCVESEASLISFNEAGEAEKAFGIEDEDDLCRTEKTIDILGLNKVPELVACRARKWEKCSEQISQYTKPPKTSLALKQVYRFLAIRFLKEMIQYEEEFSSVALACLQKTAPQALLTAVLTSGPADKNNSLDIVSATPQSSQSCPSVDITDEPTSSRLDAKQRLQQTLRSLEETQKIIYSQWTELRKALAIETEVLPKMKYAKQVEEKKQELDQIEQEIQEIEDKLS